MAFQNSSGDFDPTLVVDCENLSVKTLQTLKKENVVAIATFLDPGDEVCKSTKLKIIAEISVYLQLDERAAQQIKIAAERERINADLEAKKKSC